MKIIKYMPIFLTMICTLLPMSRGGRIGGIGSGIDSGSLGVGRSGNFHRGGGAPSGLARGQHMRTPQEIGRGKDGLVNRNNAFRSQDRVNAQRHYLDKSYKGHNWRWWRRNNPAYFNRYFPLAFYGSYGYYPPMYYGYYDDLGLDAQADSLFEAEDTLNPAPYDGKNSTDECIARCRTLTSLSDKECMFGCANR